MTRLWPKSRLAEFIKILLNICFDHILLEQGKKEDAERKRLEALAKKKERDELLEAENQSATPKAKAAPAKVTQAQIKAEQAKRMEAMRKAAVAKAEPATHLSAPLEENVNRYDLLVKICPVHCAIIHFAPGLRSRAKVQVLLPRQSGCSVSERRRRWTNTLKRG